MSDLWYGTSGPKDARIVLVGEAWGAAEHAAKSPFCGGSGQELNRILAESGLQRDAIFCTNVIAKRPPNNEMWRFFEVAKGNPKPALRGLHPTGELLNEGIVPLYRQLDAIKPDLVIAAGNYALWALTHCTSSRTAADTEGRRVPSGIESWRGSMWFSDVHETRGLRVLPIIHPAAIMREWYKRPVTKHDLSTRVPLALKGDWRPKVEPVIWAPPTYDQAVHALRGWLAAAEVGPLRLVCDIETARGLMTCIGFASSAEFCMVIPFVRLEGTAFGSFWTLEQEHELLSLMRKVFRHPNIKIEGQNFLYDIQYIAAFLGVVPTLDFDTMLAHHLLFPGTPKGLDYLSSLYCHYHWYWKEDGKEWDTKDDLIGHLKYNGLDGIRTFEVATVLRDLIRTMGQEDQWKEECAKNALALRMMLRGVRIDQKRRNNLALQLMTAREQYASWFDRMIPQALSETNSDVKWWDSSFQQRDMFSEDFGFQLPRHRKTGQITFGKEALTELSKRHPEFTKLFDRIREYRSLGVFFNTFVKAPLDPDGRMRCMFNTSGTETFRWSSSSNAFNRGTNLQNIPAGTED